MISLPNPLVLSEKVQTLFDELKADSYHDEDMIEFIQEHGQENFLDRYVDYVAVGEEYDYEAVDAFIEQFGIQSFTQDAFHCAYRGQYDSKADYAYDYVNDVYSIDFPGFVEVDWDATFDNLQDVAFSNGYVFNKQF